VVRRPITRPLGAAAGGLLAAAFLPTATALADNYEIIPDPSSAETITGFFGDPATPPALAGSIQGQQVFEVFDTTTDKTVGTFDADESTNPSVDSPANELILVTKDLSGTTGTGSGDTPPVGSVIDIANPGAGDETIYSDLASPRGDVITYESSPDTYDAAAGLATHTVDSTPIQLGDGYDLGPAAGDTEDFTAVSGMPPYDFAVEGTQVFDVYNAATGQVTGTFDGDVTNTSDIFGNDTEEILVTQDVSGMVGTAAGDTPAVGSMYNVFYDDGDKSDYNLYSVTPSSSGDVISDTWVSPTGDTTVPVSFDAATALTVNSFTDPSDDLSFVPVGSEQISGINGVPPLDSSIQGYQEFDVDNASGNPIGVIDADVTTYRDALGGSSEAILVTGDSGTTGTAAGDLPPVGSEFDIVNDGGGYETVYSDLVSTTGANVISETWVTPMGDFTIPTTMDLAANLADSSLFVPTSLADLVSSLF
jgi:hypothetical protein